VLHRCWGRWRNLIKLFEARRKEGDKKEDTLFLIDQGSDVLPAVSCSKASMFAETSSLIAAWGHPPVSTARIRAGGTKALFWWSIELISYEGPARWGHQAKRTLSKNSASSFVKMSFVTTPTDWLSLKYLQRENTSAVLPLRNDRWDNKEQTKRQMGVRSTYLPTGPPMPTVNARSEKLALYMHQTKKSSWTKGSKLIRAISRSWIYL